jgi:replicative DNA helicase
MVMFLYRPEYYGITEDEDGHSTVGVGEIIIAKHRNGSLQNVKLRFIGKYTKFTDLDINVPYRPQDALYGNKFPSGASGQEFESGNTIRLQSKANGGDQGDSYSSGFGGDESAPF